MVALMELLRWMLVLPTCLVGVALPAYTFFAFNSLFDFLPDEVRWGLQSGASGAGGVWLPWVTAPACRGAVAVVAVIGIMVLMLGFSLNTGAERAVAGSTVAVAVTTAVFLGRRSRVIGNE